VANGSDESRYKATAQEQVALAVQRFHSCPAAALPVKFISTCAQIHSESCLYDTLMSNKDLMCANQVRHCIV
jgi:hypothetical protein